MTMVIRLPQELEERLRRKADARALRAEDLALDILAHGLEEEIEPTLEAVVARIKSLPPNPDSIHPATGTLEEYLNSALPEPTDFDVDQWEKEWAEVEAEMKTITRENDIAEGRG